jgi:ankyrin repeat protein
MYDVKEIISKDRFRSVKLEDVAEQLYMACVRGDVNTVEILIRSGTPIDLQISGGNTVLSLACRYDGLSIIRTCIRYQANLNHRNDKGETPLIIATRRNYSRVVKLLLRHRADPNLLDYEGNTALTWTANLDRQEICEELLKSDQIDVNMAGGDQRTPLIQSVIMGHDMITRILTCDRRIQLEKRDNLGKTALIHAVCLHSIGLVKILANPDTVGIADCSGVTPLMIACQDKQLQIVIRLLRTGDTRVRSQDEEGKTALDRVAERPSQRNIYILLSSLYQLKVLDSVKRIQLVTSYEIEKLPGLVRSIQFLQKWFRRKSVNRYGVVTEWQEYSGIGKPLSTRLVEISTELGFPVGGLSKRQLCYQLALDYDQYHNGTNGSGIEEKNESSLTGVEFKNLPEREYYRDPDGYCFTRTDLAQLKQSDKHPYTRQSFKFDIQQVLESLPINPAEQIHLLRPINQGPRYRFDKFIHQMTGQHLSETALGRVTGKQIKKLYRYLNRLSKIKIPDSVAEINYFSTNY